MNKIIWKDIESTDIKGLMICELPPITKPKMRVQETTIDGVDGSIIEELGYESYDKTIKIGLTKGFDIDEVIEYFTGEGNVIFSNEPERYYKARIIEQIDFERLLRFKTATVKFRVQPFKYEYEEKTQKTKTGSAEGTEIKITDAKATEIKIDGRSTQDGTPTPEAPVEIKSVGYTNLFDIEKATKNVYLDAGTGETGSSGVSSTSDYIKVKANETYTLSYDYETLLNTTNRDYSFYDGNKKSLGGGPYNPSNKTTTITPTQDGFIRFAYDNNCTDIKFSDGKTRIEVKATNETGTNTVVLELNEPLRSLPNGVKDIAYIKNNKLYVDRKVGSFVLDGSENWSVYPTQKLDNTSYFLCTIGLTFNNIKNFYSSHFVFAHIWGNDVVGLYLETTNVDNVRMRTPNSIASTPEELKTWLSNNNVLVDYELATPVTEEVGNLTILELVDGENNISNSENANMIIDYIDNKMIINNFGNHTSKPIFEIEGAGTIKFILNGYAVFNYTFDNDDKVVIDSEKQDAYLGNVLKNRNMTGEFPILNKGKNIITWEGLVKNIEVSLKSRWI